MPHIPLHRWLLDPRPPPASSHPIPIPISNTQWTRPRLVPPLIPLVVLDRRRRSRERRRERHAHALPARGRVAVRRERSRSCRLRQLTAVGTGSWDLLGWWGRRGLGLHLRCGECRCIVNGKRGCAVFVFVFVLILVRLFNEHIVRRLIRRYRRRVILDCIIPNGLYRLEWRRGVAYW